MDWPKWKRKMAYGSSILVLILMNISWVAVAGFYGTTFYYELSGRLPYLRHNSIHHWINLFLICVTLGSGFLDLVVLYTATLDRFNFRRYQKINPWLVGYGVIFCVFGIMDLAMYVGMGSSTADLVYEVRNYGSPAKATTRDGFQIPAWLDYFQAEEHCCGLTAFYDYNGHGILNGTKVDYGGIPLAKHGVPATCCKDPDPSCGPDAFQIHIWEQRRRIYMEGCGDRIRAKLGCVTYCGMILCLIYSGLSFGGWLTLHFIAKGALKKVGVRNDRKVQASYCYNPDGYLSHLQNIYLDVSGVSAAMPPEEPRPDHI